MSREDIRQAFAAAAATVFQGKIYTTRITDNRNDSEYVSVYFDDGEVEQSFSGDETTSNIVVRFSKQRATDSQLDDQSDLIRGAIESHAGVAALVKRPVHTRFEYEPDGTHNGINYVYRILY